MINFLFSILVFFYIMKIYTYNATNVSANKKEIERIFEKLFHIRTLWSTHLKRLSGNTISPAKVIEALVST